MKTVFYNGEIFTGEAFAEGGYVEVSGGKITAIGDKTFDPDNIFSNMSGRTANPDNKSSSFTSPAANPDNSSYKTSNSAANAGSPSDPSPVAHPDNPLYKTPGSSNHTDKTNNSIRDLSGSSDSEANNRLLPAA